ncbi:MAG: hypothetical protein ACLT3W_06390 [Bifidobacterium pseudocatenulatum]
MEVDPDQAEPDWQQQIAQGVELQKDSKTGNQYVELGRATAAGTAIYRD